MTLQELILRFIRGEADWRDLREHGLRIAFTEAEQVTVSGQSGAVVRPSIRDIACGLIKHKADASRLRQWASVILAVNEIDMKALGGNVIGEVFLEALWDAAHGDDVEDTAFSLAEKSCQ